jgi:hypothetical protein
MVVTLEQVIAVLAPDEPNYEIASKLGPDALPHLDALIKGDDISLAVKATSLASFIQDDRSADVLINAAKSKHDVVRLAAASGSPNLKVKGVHSVLKLLSADKDPSISRRAKKSLASFKSND